MKNRVWFIIAILFLLLSNIMTRAKLEISNKRLNENTFALSKCDSIRKNEIKDVILTQFNLDLSTTRLQSEKSDENFETFREFAGNCILIVYFNENVCKSCILSIIMDLEILADYIGSDKIVLAGSFGSEEKLNEYFNGAKLNFPCVLVNKFIFFNYSEAEPLVFVLEKSLNIKFLYSPIKFPEIREIYFKTIIPSYFKN
jgi:hypothetical protein